MRDRQVKPRKSSKRKRSSMDPNLQQGYPNKKEEVTMPDDLYQKQHDDIDPDTIHQNRINARREEALQKKIMPHKGID